MRRHLGLLPPKLTDPETPVKFRLAGEPAPLNVALHLHALSRDSFLKVVVALRHRLGWAWL